METFLCEETALTFHTSPYAVKDENLQYIQQNAMSFKMGCEVFNYFNGTMNNTIAHFSFLSNNTYLYEAEVFDSNYDLNNITVNRTDTNLQYFNLTMGEDINFL